MIPLGGSLREIKVPAAPSLHIRLPFSLSPYSAGCFFGGEVRLESQTSADSAEGTAPPPVESENPSDLKRPIPKVTSDSFISELVSDREGQIAWREPTPNTPILEEESVESDMEEKDKVLTTRAMTVSPSQSGQPNPQWSNVDLEEAQTHLTVQTGGDAAETTSLSSIAAFNLGLEEPYGPDEHPLWAWVSGGGCSIDSYSQLNWFHTPGKLH